MTKKYKAKKELEEAVAIKPTEEQCQVCRQPFWGSSLSRDSHYKLYPSHLSGKKENSGKPEAILTENLSPKAKKPRKNPDA